MFESSERDWLVFLSKSPPTHTIQLLTVVSETRKVFLEDMKKFHFQYIYPYSSFVTDPGPLPQVREDRIRIAVLDTGILASDNLIRAAKDQIRGYWTPGKLRQASAHDCKDSYGHGTHVVRTLLEVAPFADIFIAKISENKDLEESKVHYIADVRHSCVRDANLCSFLTVH
jgi:hypothetical protein